MDISGNPVRSMFRTLSPDVCREILSRNQVGRLAYARGNRVDIQPVSYVFADDWLYGRTSPGAKLEMIGGGWWPVAFEVDEIDSLFCWRSVVVHGGFYTLPEGGTPSDQQEWEKGVEVLRRLSPEIFTPDDPVPDRNVVFRIAVQELSGKEAVPEDSSGS
jgi:uncharacterized protein